MPLGRDILVGALPRALNGFTTLALNVYAARFLDPQEFAIVGFSTACFIMADGIFGSALDLAVAGRLKTADATPATRPAPIEHASVLLKALVGLVLVLLAFLAGESLGWKVFQRPGGRTVFLFVSGATAAILFLRSVQLFYQLRFRFHVSGALDASLSFLRAAVIVGIFAVGIRSGTALVGGHAFSLAAIAVPFGIPVLRGIAASASSMDARAAANILRAAGMPLVAFAVGSLVARLDLFLVAGRGNAQDVGYYTAALTLLAIPEVMASYMAPVLLPRIALYRAAGTFERLFRGVLFTVAATMLVAWLASLIFHEDVFKRLYPAHFSPAFRLQQLLLPGVLASASIMPLTLNYLILTCPRAFVIADILFGVVLWALNSVIALSLTDLAVLVSALRCIKALALHGIGLKLARAGK